MLARLQRESEAHVPIELAVAFVANLLKLLKAFNNASDRNVAKLLQRGMVEGMASMQSGILREALEAAVAKIETYQRATGALSMLP
jgi:hypothetical protein